MNVKNEIEGLAKEYASSYEPLSFRVIRNLQSMSKIKAPDLRNGTIAATLQEFGYLITKDGVIDR